MLKIPVLFGTCNINITITDCWWTENGHESQQISRKQVSNLKYICMSRYVSEGKVQVGTYARVLVSDIPVLF